MTAATRERATVEDEWTESEIAWLDEILLERWAAITQTAAMFLDDEYPLETVGPELVTLRNTIRTLAARMALGRGRRSQGLDERYNILGESSKQDFDDLCDNLVATIGKEIRTFAKRKRMQSMAFRWQPVFTEGTGR